MIQRLHLLFRRPGAEDCPTDIPRQYLGDSEQNYRYAQKRDDSQGGTLDEEAQHLSFRDVARRRIPRTIAR